MFYRLLVLFLFCSVAAESSLRYDLTDASEYFPFVDDTSETYGLWPLFTPLVNVSESCRVQSLRYVQSALSSQMWAISMLDSTGRLPRSGFLSDHLTVTVCSLVQLFMPGTDCSVLQGLAEQTIKIPFGYTMSIGNKEGCLAAGNGADIEGKHCLNVILPNQDKLGAQLSAILGYIPSNIGRNLQDSNLFVLMKTMAKVPAFREYLDDGTKIIEKMATNCTQCNQLVGQLHNDFLRNGSNDEPPPSLIDILQNAELLLFLIWVFKNFETQAGMGQAFIGYGMCVPEACTFDDIGTNMEAFLGLSLFNAMPVSEVHNSDELLCMSRHAEPYWTPRTTVILVVFGIIGFFLTVGTALDVFLQFGQHTSKRTKASERPLGVQALLAFSIYSNMKAIMSTKSAAPGKAKGDVFTAINGIRFLSMTWVVLGHTFVVIPTMAFIDNPSYIVKIISGGMSVAFRAVVNGTPSVDTFFLMSGFLVALGLFKELDKVKDAARMVKVLLYFYIHRYIRISIPLALTIAFGIAVLPLISHASQSQMSEITARSQSDACYDRGWTQLLYVNNFYQRGSDCLGVTWYLGNDMMFYWVSPLIILPMWKFSKFGVIMPILWWCAVLASFTAGTIYVTIRYKLGFNGNPIPNVSDMEYVMKLPNFYNSPLHRFQPFLVGILLGYIIYTLKKSDSNPKWLNKWTNGLGWVVATVSGALVVYGIEGSFTAGTELTAGIVLYNGLQRLTWGLAVAWVIFSCAKGYGGMVNDLLSWSFFTPLARLSFMTYLVHIMVQLFTFAYFATFSMELHWLLATGFFFGLLMISMGVALVFTLAFESPFIRLDKLLLGRAFAPPKKKD